VREKVKFTQRWDDLRFPVTSVNNLSGQQPGLEAATGMLLFDAAGTETVLGLAQMPHSWREGSAIIPHVHWSKTTSASGNVLWRVEYELVNNGEVAALDYGTGTLDTSTVVGGTPDTDTANKTLISSFGEVDMTGYPISTLIFWKVSRIGGDSADTYGADARLFEFDIHYQLDSLGSQESFRKQGTRGTTGV
jgi:hypothetical protein